MLKVLNVKYCWESLLGEIIQKYQTFKRDTTLFENISEFNSEFQITFRSVQINLMSDLIMRRVKIKCLPILVSEDQKENRKIDQ